MSEVGDLGDQSVTLDAKEYAQELKKVVSTERSLDDYLHFLGLNQQDLEGKVILDLGSGWLQPFATQIKEKGINATVVSLDPKLGAEEYRNPSYLNPDVANTAVAALGEKLPFQDGSFDYVLAIESLPRYFMNKSDISIFLEEAMRIVKPGGEAIIWPLTYSDITFDYSRYPQRYDPILENLRNEGFNLKTEPVEFQSADKMRAGTRLSIEKPPKVVELVEKAA